MQTIYMCGKRGLGDIVVGLCNMIDTIQEDSHIIFYYPPNHEYENKIPELMKEVLPLKNLNITYEVSHDFYSIDGRVCRQKFKDKDFNREWFLSSSSSNVLRKFNTQWKGNTSGPIGLCLNNENTNVNYPMPGKWFDTKLNELLVSLIDEKKYVTFGRMFTITECIAKLAECRYVVGVDGGWAHICNAMRVPYYLSLNNYTPKHYDSFFKNHPTLKYIKQEEVLQYCIL